MYLEWAKLLHPHFRVRFVVYPRTIAFQSSPPSTSSKKYPNGRNSNEMKWDIHRTQVATMYIYNSYSQNAPQVLMSPIGPVAFKPQVMNSWVGVQVLVCKDWPWLRHKMNDDRKWQNCIGSVVFGFNKMAMEWTTTNGWFRATSPNKYQPHLPSSTSQFFLLCIYTYIYTYIHTYIH